MKAKETTLGVTLLFLVTIVFSYLLLNTKIMKGKSVAAKTVCTIKSTQFKTSCNECHFLNKTQALCFKSINNEPVIVHPLRMQFVNSQLQEVFMSDYEQAEE